jgi:hypothetical protein
LGVPLSEPPITGPLPVHAGQQEPPRRLRRGSDQLRHLVGRGLLVGVSIFDPDGGLLHREQFFGQVTVVGDGVVVVTRPNGEAATLPADPQAFRTAPPGEYRLAGSGEVIRDPDYLTTWNIKRTVTDSTAPETERT